MKNVTIVAILTVSGFLTACHTNPSNPSTTPPTPSVIDAVRNGYLESNKTTTVGKALEGTFPNGTWKTLITQKGVTIVEFDGAEPFGTFSGGGCAANLICAALDKKLVDYCSSDAGKALYSKDQSSHVAENALEMKLEQNQEQATCWDTTTKQHANDPIPVVVQFSINHDGTTFQYEANDMGLSTEALFEKIYK
jgi:hypothetical protein